MKRNIVVIVGSENNLRQCAKGLKLLTRNEANVCVYVRSVHRHLNQLLWLLQSLSQTDEIDVIIAGADKAAHLPGCVDAFLRNHLRDSRINVIGVAFKGGLLNSLAARLSITQVPGTQVIYAGLGKAGFLKACQIALTKPLLPIKLVISTPSLDLTLAQAIELTK